MIDDAELLRRYAEERSEAAFAELVQRHVDLVYSAALRRLGGDTHGAADVVHQVFRALARQAAALSRHTVMPAWLYSATRNIAIDHVRAEKRRKLREQEAHIMHELNSNAGTPTANDWERLRPALDEVMDELGERDREAVLLRFFARRPFAEIGATLRTSEDAARMRVDRALEKLRALLVHRGISSTGAALGMALSSEAVSAAPTGLALAVASGIASSAAPTAGMIASTLHLMMTSKIVAVAVGVALLAIGLGTATNELGARRAATKSLALTQAEVARLADRLRDVQQRAGAAEHALQDERTALAEADQALATAVAQARPRDPVEAGKQFLAAHPEAQGLLEEITRADMAAMLIALYRVVNLAPIQREQFERLLVQCTERNRTIDSPEGPLTIRQNKSLTMAQWEAQTRQLLGDSVYSELVTTGKELSDGVDFAVQLGSATYRSQPLTPLQGDQMLRIFAAATAAERKRKPGEPTGLNWGAITSEATGVLSTMQLAVLAQVQRRDEEQRRNRSPGRQLNPPRP